MHNYVSGINPAILVWAREHAGYSVEGIASKFNSKSASDILDWENGRAYPTYSQLEKLAYTYYKRPIAVFFLPKPPPEIHPKELFRSLPEYRFEELSHKTLYEIRKAEARVMDLYEINDGNNPIESPIFKRISLTVNDEIEYSAANIRKLFGINLKKQLSWNRENSLINWRMIFETNGIFVFKRPLEQSISGFCIIDKDFPIIYLNNSSSPSRQIFSLFHELIHILLCIPGITSIHQFRITNELNPIDRKNEIFCNKLASEILIPKSHFAQYLNVQRIDENWLEELSNRYSVSRETILRKYLDFGKVSNDFYERMANKWNDEYLKHKLKIRKPSGGHGLYNQTHYLGDTYLKLLFSKYFQGRITQQRLAEYLGTKASNIHKYEEVALSRMLKS